MANQNLSRSQSIIQSSYPSSPQAAGMIIAFAGSSAPAGWAICDGSELPIASYGQLYARIGTTWNLCTNPLTGVANGDPAGGNFRLPDLRGTFLRGVGDFTDNTMDTVLGGFQAQKTAKNGLTVTNNAVTSSGQSQTHTHTGSSSLRSLTSSGSLGLTTGSSGVDYDSNYDSSGASVDHTHSVTSNVVLNVGDSETRPQNVGINYLIKLYDDAGAIVMSGSPFVGSEFQPAPITISGNNTLDYSKFYTCDSVSATTQTLPAATGSNKVITIENTNTGLLTVDGNASETINGSLNQVIGQYASLKVRDYAAGKWIVMH